MLFVFRKGSYVRLGMVALTPYSAGLALGPRGHACFPQKHQDPGVSSSFVQFWVWEAMAEVLCSKWVISMSLTYAKQISVSILGSVCLLLESQRHFFHVIYET